MRTPPLTRIHVAVIAALFIPLAAHAITADEIKAQIESILGRISVLRAEIQSRNASSTESLKGPATSSTLRVSDSNERPALRCLSLARTLSFGKRGQDVRELQRFLIKDGYLLSDLATGYFGLLTEEGVREWQLAHLVVLSPDRESGAGVVGPKTRAAILASCSRTKPQMGTLKRTCPAAPSIPASSECEGIWQKGFDASGCLTGYQCLVFPSTTTIATSTPTPTVTVRLATTSIRILSPAVGVSVTGGNTLKISWQSTNPPPRATVSFSLIDAVGKSLGVIAQSVNPSGVYLWRVPAESNDCSSGESAFDCIMKLSRCEGSESICSVPPGTYAIVATLSNSVSTTSPPFQIAGTALSSLVKALVGAPVIPPPFPSVSGTSSPVAGMCMHDGSLYPDGSTLSVPCEVGHCTSATAGYITGTCTNGQWCIPLTNYCAKSFRSIDVSVYQGGGAAPIGTGGALNCPQPGWRVYLDCSVLPGCRTGWNICTGSGWTYDPDQTVH